MAELKPCRLLRLPEVTARTSLQRAAIYKRIAEHSFPAPRAISSRCSVWREDEIQAWVDTRPVAPPRKAARSENQRAA